MIISIENKNIKCEILEVKSRYAPCKAFDRFQTLIYKHKHTCFKITLRLQLRSLMPITLEKSFQYKGRDKNE